MKEFAKCSSSFSSRVESPRQHQQQQQQHFISIREKNNGDYDDEERDEFHLLGPSSSSHSNILFSLLFLVLVNFFLVFRSLKACLPSLETFFTFCLLFSTGECNFHGCNFDSFFLSVIYFPFAETPSFIANGLGMKKEFKWRKGKKSSLSMFSSSVQVFSLFLFRHQLFFLSFRCVVSDTEKFRNLYHEPGRVT